MSFKNLEKSVFSCYQRVAVFVDVQNMFYSAKYLKRARLDFEKLMKLAVRGRQLIRAICYMIENPDVDQEKFMELLKKKGYELKTKSLRVRSDGTAKGDWDMGIALDVIALAEKLDIVILVTGDGDFTDLVYYLKSRGVLVEVISFPNSTNEDLIKAVDRYFPVDETLLYKR
tara:strand:- start:747 stop:1262 length:516 start_codon:yes stop_codon:yes gene_type:complete